MSVLSTELGTMEMKGAAYIEVAGINASMQESMGTRLGHLMWNFNELYTVTIRNIKAYRMRT